jgi:hypothetical protein
LKQTPANQRTGQDPSSSHWTSASTSFWYGPSHYQTSSLGHSAPGQARTTNGQELTCKGVTRSKLKLSRCACACQHPLHQSGRSVSTCIYPQNNPADKR